MIYIEDRNVHFGQNLLHEKVSPFSRQKMNNHSCKNNKSFALFTMYCDFNSWFNTAFKYTELNTYYLDYFGVWFELQFIIIN